MPRSESAKAGSGGSRGMGWMHPPPTPTMHRNWPFWGPTWQLIKSWKLKTFINKQHIYRKKLETVLNTKQTTDYRQNIFNKQGNFKLYMPSNSLKRIMKTLLSNAIFKTFRSILPLNRGRFHTYIKFKFFHAPRHFTLWTDLYQKLPLWRFGEQ